MTAQINVSPDSDIAAPPDEQGYNGWSNYETWCANLWLTNDESTYGYALTLTACELQTWITDDESPSTWVGLYADLLGHALCSIDWYEIYDSLHDEEG